MPKGIPISGKRKSHARWSLETLWPLYKRWEAKELLNDIAKSVNTSAGRLRGAFTYYEFGSPPHVKNRYRSVVKTQKGGAYENYTQSLEFDAIRHRSARHYKGNFEL